MKKGLGLHLKSKGAAKVLLTAPGKGEIKNVVYGVNHDIIDGNDRILSAASCTTNAITPVLKAIYDKFGILNGHVETVHSYTNDQNLIDNYHKGERRGRGAALNMVITETGAARGQWPRLCRQLKGKLTGNAIRVPTPNVSLAILNLNLEQEASLDAFNGLPSGDSTLLRSPEAGRLSSILRKWFPVTLLEIATPVSSTVRPRSSMVVVQSCMSGMTMSLVIAAR